VPADNVRAAGVPLKAGAIDGLGSRINRDAPIKPSRFDPKADPFRIIGSDDRIHYSVAARPAHNHPRADARIETEGDEQSLGR
jgi:hypothetical protein